MLLLKRWSTAVQLGILTSSLVALSSVVIGWITYHRLDHDIVQSEVSELQQEAHTAAIMFGEKLAKLRADANFLSQTPPPTGYVRALRNGGIDPDDGTSTSALWTTQLGVIFEQFMAANPEYVQIRYLALEPNGKELLRVNRQGGAVVRVPNDELQQKSDRYYFQEAVKNAAPAAVYTSRLDLNREFGELTIPLLPVVRAVAPVYVGDDEAPYGFIVINLAADAFFEDIRREVRENRDLYVVNGNGDFVVHPDTNRRFASELGHEFRIGDQWPTLAGVNDQPQFSAGLTSKQVDGRTFAVGAEKLPYDTRRSGLQLMFILAGDLKLVSPALTVMRSEIAWTALVLLLLAIAAAIFLSRAFTKRLRSLARSAHAVAAGNYDLSLPDLGRDEVGLLATVMTQMAAQIKDKIDRLQRTEAQLTDNANFLESVFFHVPAMMFVKDAKDLRFVRFNRAAETITGFSSQELIGKNDFDMFPAEEARFFTDCDRKVLEDDGDIVVGQEVITRKDGSKRTLRTKKVAIGVTSGGSGYLLGISEDVTEREKAARDLEDSERRFRSIFDTAAEGIVTVEEDGTVTSFNHAASEIFGLAASDVVGKSFNTLLAAPQGGTAHDASSGNLRAAGVGGETEGIRSGGAVFPIRISVGETMLNDRRTYTKIILDLSKDRENERRMVEARRQAEAANRAKSDFLATMSHELRTPLNAIIGYSEMLAEDAEHDSGLAGVAEDLQKIRNAGQHLLELINDVLDLSKIEAGSADLSVTLFSVSGLVGEVCDTARRLVENNGNRFDVALEEPLGEMQSDPTRLRQILLNLLSNAAKFTSNGCVKLTVTRSTEASSQDRRLILKVRDNGIGIQQKSLERIFEAFSQADSSTTREFGGTGLGLAITRSNCELMGGKIYVSSTPGEGSEFVVELPVYLPMSDDAPDTSARTTIRDTPDHCASDLILVIEDDSSARLLLATQLEKLGWRVAMAASGIEGLKLAREVKPCAIVLDVMMPELDGWSVLKILKDDARLSEIPVVLCTIVDDKQRGFALGAADYLLKPVSREQLKRTFTKYCANPPCDVLIVEDDESTRDIYCRAARGLNWRVTEAGTGKEALRQIARNRPDLILLDLMMPELDGFGVVEALQRNSEWQDIPVVIVTAKDLTPDDRERLNGYVKYVVEKGDRNESSLRTIVTNALDRIASG